jgi:HPt (histidine-containing phosphotransfer) domain-containing protein
MTIPDQPAIEFLLTSMGTDGRAYIRAILKDADNYLAELKHAAAAGDSATALEIAHSLTSVFLQSGAESLAALARHIEYQARGNQPVHLADVATLENSYKPFRRFLLGIHIKIV